MGSITIGCQSPTQYLAKYLVVVAEKGVTKEVNHFVSFEEAKNAVGEIWYDDRLGPGEINRSGIYDVSIWEWTEDRFERVTDRDWEGVFHEVHGMF